MTSENALLEEFAQREYEHGFVTDIEADAIPAGLSEDVVRLISSKKNEPEWLLEWRLESLSPLVDAGGAELAQRQVPADRLPSVRLLTRRRSKNRSSIASMKLIRCCWKPTRNSAFRWKSKKCSPTWPSMRCSIAFRS